MAIKKILFFGLLFVSLSFFGCTRGANAPGESDVEIVPTPITNTLTPEFLQQFAVTPPVKDGVRQELATQDIPGLRNRQASARGNLIAVPGAQEVGSVQLGWDDKQFYAHIDFSTTEPATYVGWLVRTAPYASLSLGSLIQRPDGYILGYTSEHDFSDHRLFLVTRQTAASIGPGDVVAAAVLDIVE